MTRRAINCSVLCSLLTGFYSCGDNSRKVYENDLHLKPAFLASIDTANYTTIQWLDTSLNFGSLQEGSRVKLKFRFRNNGSNPLLISEVKPSCGCIITAYPEEAILPDEEDFIAVEFNSTGHPGYVSKNVLVVSNTKNKLKQLLTFSGDVSKHER